MKIACRLVVLFEVRTCSYEFLAFGVAGELLEVLDETTGQICCLLVPLLGVLVRVARIENLGIHARKCSRDLEIEYRQRLGRGLVDRTVRMASMMPRVSLIEIRLPVPFQPVLTR